jgi:hypothetical protein
MTDRLPDVIPSGARNLALRRSGWRDKESEQDSSLRSPENHSPRRIMLLRG